MIQPNTILVLILILLFLIKTNQIVHLNIVDDLKHDCMDLTADNGRQMIGFKIIRTIFVQTASDGLEI